MPKIELKINSRYWRLVIIEEAEQIWYVRYFKTICDCWNIRIVAFKSIRSWATTSCWCLQKEKFTNTSHKMTWTKIYQAWKNMRYRCENKKHKAYKNYGWRWITVCDRWKNSFENFYEDMWESFEKHFFENNWDTSIDREDNNWNYCKSNCSWKTDKDQCRNRRSNVVYKWKCLAEWCEELWLNERKVWTRVSRWWSYERALELI